MIWQREEPGRYRARIDGVDYEVAHVPDGEPRWLIRVLDDRAPTGGYIVADAHNRKQARLVLRQIVAGRA